MRSARRLCRFVYLAGIVAVVLATGAIMAQDKPLKTGPFAISAEPLGVKPEAAFANLQLRRPIGIAYPPDGSDRLAVISQYGSILIFPNQPDAEEPKTL